MAATKKKTASKTAKKGASTKSATQAKSAKSKGTASGAKKKSSTARKTGGSHSSHPLTDHEEIQQWAEERGAIPTCVRGTGGGGDVGMIRLEFPGFGGEEESLEQIEWDEWFEKFEDNNLALMVQDTTARGQKSNFNKLVKRTTAERPRTRSAH